MNQNQLEELLRKLPGNHLSDSDRTALMEYLAEPANKTAVQQAVAGIMAQNTAGSQLLSEESSGEIIAAILATESQEQQGILRSIPTRRKTYRWIAAASVILLIGAAGIWKFTQRDAPAPVPVPVIADRSPASNGAILTLANGNTILLDTLKDGAITTSDGMNIHIKDGHLMAASSDNSSNNTIFNKVSTPKGRQYMMVLADGSKAWLNAGSSLEYPISFNGNERTVSITGEVYFEISSNPAQPFKVKAKDMEVQVLGTAFNINAYDDEASINTTLASGSVRIASAGTAPVVLKPAQQARFQPEQPIKIMNAVDLSKILAWKNGYFSFDDLTVQQVMKLIERWYDVDVQYEGTIPADKFEGMVSRNMKLSGIIKSLKDMEIEARQEGRTLIISKKKQ